MKNSILKLLLLGSLFLSSTMVAGKEDFGLVEWQNPAPGFAEIQLDLETVSEIIGRGQLVISHKPRDIELWTAGEIKHYQDVRFSSAMIIVNSDADTLRQRVLDTENYGEFMPQIRDSSIAIRDGRHFMAHYTQKYSIGPFPLRAKFQWQHSLEKNGDVSLLLHDGDVDAAVGRYEFIELDNNKTLLVLTTWQDLSTAKFTYRMMIKANPDFRAAFPAVAASILLLQYRDSFEKVNNSKPDPETVPDTAPIPILTEKPEQLQTLIRLAENGTLVLIEEKKWYRDKNNNNELQSIVFASAIRVMPVSVGEAGPLILDIEALPKFTKEIKEIEVSEIENGKRVEARLKIGLGVVGISLDFHFDMVEYRDSENIRLLLNGGGDMYPMLGAYEFAGYQKNGQDYTFGVLTQGGSISNEAPFIVKMIAKRLPQFDFIRTIFATLPQIEKQQNWVMEQIEAQEQSGLNPE